MRGKGSALSTLHKPTAAEPKEAVGGDAFRQDGRRGFRQVVCSHSAGMDFGCNIEELLAGRPSDDQSRKEAKALVREDARLPDEGKRNVRRI